TFGAPVLESVELISMRLPAEIQESYKVQYDMILIWFENPYSISLRKGWMVKERLWTKDFIIIIIFNFLIMLWMFLLVVRIIGCVVDECGIATSTAGLVAGIFIVGSLLGRILTGHQLSLIGARKIMYIGTVMFVITYGLYFIADNLTLLLI